MEELRSEIWDYLYRDGQPQLVNSIADHMQSDPESIRLAVDHEWFEVTHDLVAIAWCGDGQQPGHSDQRDFQN